MLPLAAVLIVRGLALPPALAGGVIIIAAAPIAALSNYYALLARADLALAVALTAVSSLAATVTMPLIVALGFKLLRLDAAGFEPPIGTTGTAGAHCCSDFWHGTWRSRG